MYNPIFLFSLESHSKQTGDEYHLLHAVSFFYTTNLPFPEHVHRAHIRGIGSPRGLEGKEKKPIPSLTNRLMKR